MRDVQIYFRLVAGNQLKLQLKLKPEFLEYPVNAPLVWGVRGTYSLNHNTNYPPTLMQKKPSAWRRSACIYRWHFE